MANYAVIKKTDIANGPGVRVSLFLSGCTHKCPGCFNQDLWDFNYGRKFTSSTLEEVLESLQPDYITGLSILGGDPFDGDENRLTTEMIVRRVKNTFPQKTIWVYTGDLYENVKNLPAMNFIDVLVDGPFIEAKKNLMLKFRGSSNQRIIDVSKSIQQDRVILLDGYN